MKISIFGASGNVGSCTAYTIALQHLADEIVLIGRQTDWLAYHANDLNTAFTGQDILIRSGRTPDIHDSDIVIVAAGSAQVAGPYAEVIPRNLPVIRDISKEIIKYCPGAVIIIVTNPVCPLTYGMYLCTGFDRRKIIGYTYNDTIRFNMRLARAMGIKSDRVRGTVIGDHGNTQVLLFSSVQLDGRLVPVSEEIKQKIRDQVPETQRQLSEMTAKTGRTAVWTTSAGLAAVCRAICHDTGELIPCSVTLDGEYGCSGLSMTVPTILGKGGVREILEWQLFDNEQGLLKGSIDFLKPVMKYIEKTLGQA